MAVSEFSPFLKEEINKVKGISYPVKAGLLRRFFIRKAACRKLHPNPNDEFCSPEIGPNYEIISRYVSDYRKLLTNAADPQFMDSPVKEPIMVERIYPNGYMILNGHHRWAAACRIGLHKIAIRIVDLTQESDFRKMLASSSSPRRVTLDLDEVVFGRKDDPFLDKPLRFPLNRFYRERLRLGIPALFHMLNENNYDIWIYTANYYSMDYLRYYFRHYNVRLTGIITGTARKAPVGTDTRKELESLVNTRYTTTVHIDSEMLVRTDTASGSFDEYRLSGESGAWSRDVMKIFEDWQKKEQQP